VLVGIVISAYKLLIDTLSGLSELIYITIKRDYRLLVPWIAVLALAGLLIAWLIKKYPLSAGGGMPQVKGILEKNTVDKRPLITIVMKFFGAGLAVFAGMYMGKGGPSIQLGTAVSNGFANRFQSNEEERLALIPCGISAGLSAIFQTPISAVVFYFEEFRGKVNQLNLALTFIPSLISVLVFSAFYGFDPLVELKRVPAATPRLFLALALSGIALGILGSFYTKLVLSAKHAIKKLFANHTYLIPISVLLAICAIKLVLPTGLEDGRAVWQALSLDLSAKVALLLFAVRFILSFISLCSGAPGGMIFPVVTQGACAGSFFGILSINLGGVNPEFFPLFLIAGVTGYFCSVLRSPITAVIIAIELTGAVDSTLGLVIVSVAAYLTSYAIKCEPLDDMLYEEYKAGLKSVR